MNIPSIELTRLYETDKIASQYAALGAALGVTFQESPERQRAEQAVRMFR